MAQRGREWRLDPADLWQVDGAIAQDMLLVLQFLAGERTYADELGFAAEIATVWKQ